MALARAGKPVVIANPTMPVGPGDRGLSPPTRLILDFCLGRLPALMDCTLNMIDVRDVAAGLVSVIEARSTGPALLAGRRESHSRRAPGPALRAMRGAGAAVASALRSRTCHCYCQRVRRGSLHWQPAESNGHRRSPGAADHAFRPFSQPLRTRFGSRSTPRGPGRYRRLASPDGTHTLPSGWLILARFLPIGHPCSGYARSWSGPRRTRVRDSMQRTRSLPEGAGLLCEAA